MPWLTMSFIQFENDYQVLVNIFQTRVKLCCDYINFTTIDLFPITNAVTVSKPHSVLDMYDVL